MLLAKGWVKGRCSPFARSFLFTALVFQRVRRDIFMHHLTFNHDLQSLQVDGLDNYNSFPLTR